MDELRVDEPGASPRGTSVSRAAMAAVFLAVVIGGLSGALIGSGLVRIDCEGDCGTAQGFGALIGGVIGAAGVAVVAVLVLRAMAEWRRQGPVTGSAYPLNDRRRNPSA